MRYTRLLRFMLVTATRVAPRPYRFRVVVRLARMAMPLTRYLRSIRRRHYRAYGELDAILCTMLTALDTSGVEMDVKVSLDSLETLNDAVAGRRGVLLIGSHTMLSIFAVQRLHDAGLPLAAVMREDVAMLRPGRHGIVPKIVLSPTFMFEVRTALQRGDVVFAMIDRRETVPGLTVPLDIGGETTHIADGLIRLAVRSGVPVVFLTSWSTGSAIASALGAPTAEALHAPQVIVGQFIDFVRRHAPHPAPAAQGLFPERHAIDVR